MTTNTLAPESAADYLIRFTETYKRFAPDDIEAREAACLRVQYPFILLEIQDGDLFAGRVKHQPLGFSPQMGTGFGYYLDAPKFFQIANDPKLSLQTQRQLADILSFWQTENTSFKTRQAYPPDMQQALPSDNWDGESGIGFPLYRMSGSHLDYGKLLRLGIPGLKKEIAEKKRATKDARAAKLFDAMQTALDLLADVCRWYADIADQQSSVAPSENRQEELAEMAAVLRHIAVDKPNTLRQAMQLAFLYALLSGSLNYGRFDDYCGDFYAVDLQSGSITEEKALALVKSLWRLINERENGAFVWDGRVIIGGKGRKNEANADKLALLAIEATRHVKEVLPQLTLRFYLGQNPVLYEKALDCISEGNPYPMLYNDDVNIPAVQVAFELPFEEAADYVPFGCGEYVIYHKSFGTPSGVINLLAALLVTLHKGINPTTGQPMGLPVSDYGEFSTFEDVYNVYKKLVEYYVRFLADQEELEYQIAGQTSPFLFFSLLFDDCIEKGRAIFNGGVRYLGGTLETYGNTNAADSLLAIKKLVYEEKKFTLKELLAFLDADFKGYEKERKLCLNVPKYGNDDDEADAMLVDVDRHICEVTRNQRLRTRLHSYLVVIINNSANTTMGRYTTASPDVRHAFSPMNNGNAPSSGFDRSGVTAFLNSIVKPDTHIHAGAVQNMKFSQDLFQQHRESLAALLDTYFEHGGAQAMLNVLGKEDLENALKFPEKYQNLIVRVGGFSARFVELPRDVQEEILARTLY